MGRDGPRRSCREARDAAEDVAQDGLGWRGRRQMDADLCPHLDDAGRDLDQAQPQRVELGDAPGGALRHGAAQSLQEPVGPAVKEQAELVGDGPGAGGAVGREMGFQLLMWFSATPRRQ